MNYELEIARNENAASLYQEAANRTGSSEHAATAQRFADAAQALRDAERAAGQR